MTPTNFKLFFIILFHFILQYIGNQMFIHTATALSSNGRFFLPLSCILSLVSLSVFNIMSASVQFRSESFLYRRRRVPFLVYSGGDRPPAIAEAKSGDLFSSGDTVWVKNEWGWEIGVADGRAMARTRYPNFTDRVLDRTDNGYRWVASSTFSVKWYDWAQLLIRQVKSKVVDLRIIMNYGLLIYYRIHHQSACMYSISKHISNDQ